MILRNYEKKRRRHPRHFEELDDFKAIEGEEEKIREYDEVISEDEKEDLHQLIEWMSVE